MQCGWKKPPMLAHDIEIMEGPKKSIPSLIGLQRFDAISIGRGKRLYQFGSFVLPIRELGTAVSDGETRVVLRHSHYAVTADESGSEEIKATADTVDVNASLHVKKARQLSFQGCQEQLVMYMRAWIFDDHVNVFIPPGIEPLLEGLEMGYGPIDAGLCI
jgi:hypothetical protein